MINKITFSEVKNNNFRSQNKNDFRSQNKNVFRSQKNISYNNQSVLLRMTNSTSVFIFFFKSLSSFSNFSEKWS